MKNAGPSIKYSFEVIGDDSQVEGLLTRINVDATSVLAVVTQPDLLGDRRVYFQRDDTVFEVKVPTSDIHVLKRGGISDWQDDLLPKSVRLFLYNREKQEVV